MDTEADRVGGREQNNVIELNMNKQALTETDTEAEYRIE